MIPRSLYKILIHSVLFLFCLSLTAQINFNQGYFINNDGEKVDCLIKNYDWLNNPIEIWYKFSEMGPEKAISKDEIIEFGINGGVVFEKHVVQIDRSLNSMNRLSTVRNPEFETEELLLKKVVDGKVVLYSYTDQSLNRFFYGDDESTPQQLVYKKYRVGGTKIGENNQFKQQLLNLFNDCEGAPRSRFEKLRYEIDRLTELFIVYNKCDGSVAIVNSEENLSGKKDLFNLIVKGGIRNSNLEAVRNFINSEPLVLDFENQTSLQLGLEAEFIFNFNQNKWSAVAELYYYNYSADAPVVIAEVINGIPFITRDDFYEVEYSALEFLLGGRYSLFTGQNSRVYITPSVAVSFPINNELTESDRKIDEAVTLANFAIGAGFNYGPGYIEIKYGAEKVFFDIIESRYSSFSVLAGFSFL